MATFEVKNERKESATNVSMLEELPVLFSASDKRIQFLQENFKKNAQIYKEKDI